MSDKGPEFDESLMPAEEPAELAGIELTEAHMVFARRKWPEASEKMQAYRMRQSIWVRFQNRKPHPEDPGRKLLGGAQPGSGRKRAPIGRAIVEHFEARTKEVLDAIAAPLDPHSDATSMERHRAGMNIAKHAREEQKEQREADDYARKTDDEVKLEFARMLADMVRNGELSADDIIEGTFVDITDQPEITEQAA